ncbi:hypothetical protein ACOME3_002207 [Neoechinorhynchus agilis]
MNVGDRKKERQFSLRIGIIAIKQLHSDDQLMIEPFDSNELDYIRKSPIGVTIYHHRLMCLNSDVQEENTKKSDQKLISLNATNGPTPCHILQSLTLLSARAGYSLERYEMFGDCFLKLAVTVHLFCEYPKFTEGTLSYMRSILVSNKVLQQLSRKRALEKLIVANRFDPLSKWIPPLYSLPNVSKRKSVIDGTDIWEKKAGPEWVPSCMDESQKRDSFFDRYGIQSLSTKSIADVFEALVGCYLINGGPDAALKFIDWMGIKIISRFNFVSQTLSNELHMKCLPRAKICDQNRSTVMDAFEELIDYQFFNQSLLFYALTHPSYTGVHFNEYSYERFEFIGDAVLDYVVTRYLSQAVIAASRV